jgi:hypothetical protein
LASPKLILNRYRLRVIFLVGVVTDSVGIVLALLRPPHLYSSGIFLSVGSSIIAAAIVAYLSPVNEDCYQKFLSLGIEDVYTSRSDVENRQWVTWLRQAKRRCILFGIAHGNWRRDADFAGALLERLSNNVEIAIFFLAPNGSAAALRAKEDTGRDTKLEIETSIRILWQLREGFPPEVRPRLKLYVYEATPSLGVTWIDDFMIATHYLAGSMNVTSPALLMEPGQLSGDRQDLYGIYANNVECIRKDFSTLITHENIRHYAPEREHA